MADREERKLRGAGLGGLPERVEVYEVGPRDGLQNELRTLPTRDKARLIEALITAGEKRIEVTSFVSPKWIPQLADAEELLRLVGRRPGVTFSALVPNLKGLSRAKEAGLEEAAIFISASEAHSKTNINKSIDEAVAEARQTTEAALKAGLRVRGYLSTVWGCPYEGQVQVPRVVEISRALVDAGIYQLSLGTRSAWGRLGRRSRSSPRCSSTCRWRAWRCTCTTRAARPLPTRWWGCRWA